MWLGIPLTFFLLHSVEDGSNGNTYNRRSCWAWAMQKKVEGKIQRIGYSLIFRLELVKITIVNSSFRGVE